MSKRFKRNIVPVHPYRKGGKEPEKYSGYMSIGQDGIERIVEAEGEGEVVMVLFSAQASKNDLDKPVTYTHNKLLFPWTRRTGPARINSVWLSQESARLLQRTLNKYFAEKKEPSRMERMQTLLDRLKSAIEKGELPDSNLSAFAYLENLDANK